MDHIYPKRVFLIKTRKSEHHHWNLHIWISVVTKFQLKMIILTFWTKFAQKGYFRSKIEKTEHHHWILHVLIRVCTKFQLKLIRSCLDQNCPKRLFPVESEKNEQHHWILHIRIRLGAIFLGAMALLSQSRESWPSMAPLGYVGSSQMKMLCHF